LNPKTSAALWFTGAPDIDTLADGKSLRIKGRDFSLDVDRRLEYYSLLGVRYILAPKDHSPGLGVYAPPSEYTGTLRKLTNPLPLIYDEEIKIYENPGAAARAFMVYDIVAAPSMEEAQKAIGVKGFDLTGTAVLERPIPEWAQKMVSVSPSIPASPSQASITGSSFNTVTVEVKTPAAGLLVLTDVYAAGWTATVDGRPAQVVRVDGVFRGVPVPAGSHRVAFQYTPPGFIAGLVLALVAALICVAVVWSGRDKGGKSGTRARVFGELP
jgi:hypothetical protein